MTLVVPNAQEVLALQDWAGTAAPWALKLFGNNQTPAVGSVAGDFTEIAGGGYAAKSLAFGSWTFAAGVPSTMTYAAQGFIFTGAINAPGTIYGYYILDSNGALICAERLAAPPFTPTVNLDEIIVTPRIALQQVS